MWVSKLQTQTALSTMKAEYIALLQSMQDLIPICEVLKEIMTVVHQQEQNIHITPIPKHLRTQQKILFNTTFLLPLSLKIMRLVLNLLKCPN